MKQSQRNQPFVHKYVVILDWTENTVWIHNIFGMKNKEHS